MCRPYSASRALTGAGGEVPNATYRNHGNHAEAIEITFDPQTISYRKLLEFFFRSMIPRR
jgi:peptide methionine sulfoxide reductase MsrA